jgi:hypothetical protein
MAHQTVAHNAGKKRSWDQDDENRVDDFDDAQKVPRVMEESMKDIIKSMSRD